MAIHSVTGRVSALGNIRVWIRAWLKQVECKKVENKCFLFVPNQVLNTLLRHSLAVYVQEKEKKEEEQEEAVEEEVEEKAKQNAVAEEELRQSLGLHIGGKKWE